MTSLLDLLEIELPIVQAPMAGADSVALTAAVSGAGGLGSLACALLDADGMRKACASIRKQTSRPFNLNFFCHSMPGAATGLESNWKDALRPHYVRLGLDIESVAPSRLRLPFDAAICSAVEEIVPAVVSFHFGLPDEKLIARLKQKRIRILSSATSVAEARWLEARGCDAVIAQGAEAGGHRAMFLETDSAFQTGTMALLPQIVDAIRLPVIAAGGITDARGIAAAFVLGASAVQLGTAYLFCPEAGISSLYRETLRRAGRQQTALTNVFSGRPARGFANRFVVESGPMSKAAPPFPLAGTLVAPLRAASEKARSTDYLQMWAGQAAALGREMPAGELTQALARKAQEMLSSAAATQRS